MTIAERVEAILRFSRAARNSDKDLQVIYLQKSGMQLTPAQVELFKKMPSMETIRRTRQAIQEKGKYRADEAIEQARFDKYVKVRHQIRYNAETNTVERILE